jgi:hypothetical protein
MTSIVLVGLLSLLIYSIVSSKVEVYHGRENIQRVVLVHETGYISSVIHYDYVYSQCVTFYPIHKKYAGEFNGTVYTLSTEIPEQIMLTAMGTQHILYKI